MTTMIMELIGIVQYRAILRQLKYLNSLPLWMMKNLPHWKDLLNP